MLYLASDGYADQQNENGERLGSARLELFLGEAASLRTDEQRALLANRFERHMKGEVQRDDVTVVGIRVQ